MTTLPGIYLVQPHARLIAEGIKTLIVKSRRFDKYVNVPIYFIEDQKVYGIMVITSVRGPVNAEDVKTKLYDKHRISKAEWDTWWPGAKEVYLYEFKVIETFDPPKYFEPAPGTQTFIREVELGTSEIVTEENFETMMKKFDIDSTDVSKYSTPVLLHMHAKTHSWIHKENIKFTKEQIINFHNRLVKEMLKRGLHHNIVERPLDVVKNGALLNSEALLEDRTLLSNETLLPVSSSGVERGETISLEEVLDIYSKPFYLKRPFILIVGGIAIHGKTKGDVDFLIDFNKRIPERDTALEFRLGRALAAAGERFNGRAQFHYRNIEGAFTSYVPLYDLMLVPCERRSVVQMIAHLKNQLTMSDIKDAQARREAESARSHDEVSPMKFFLPCKPLIGHAPGEKYSLESLLTILKQSDFPVVVNKKYDGVVLVFMKQGNNIKIRTEKGIDVTHMLPETVEELKKFPHSVTLISDSELWVKDKYVGREFVGTYLMSKRKPDDSGLVHNVFDILYFYDPKISTEGDLHNLPYIERVKFLDKCPFAYSTVDVPPVKKGHFNKVPFIIARDVKELRREIKQMMKKPAAEGVVIKSVNSIYPLGGTNRKWWKLKKTFDWHGIILKVNTTKKPGIYNYRVGVLVPEGMKAAKTKKLGATVYMDVGKTMNNANRYNVGDVVVVNTEELFFYKDPETGIVQLIAYISNILGRSNRKTPSSVEETILLADEADCLRQKTEALGYVSMWRL